jgi:hypothetical protein
MSSSLNGGRLTAQPAAASWSISSALAQFACTTCRPGPTAAMQFPDTSTSPSGMSPSTGSMVRT